MELEPALAPIEIPASFPEEVSQFAHVWPEDDPAPQVGQMRDFIFDGKTYTLKVKEIMDLGGGFIGVTLSTKPS